MNCSTRSRPAPPLVALCPQHAPGRWLALTMLLALSTLGCVYAQDGSISSDAPIATHGVYNYSDSSYGYERQGLGDAVDFSMMSLNSLNGTIDRTIARANVGFLSNYANNWTLESSTGLGHTIGLGFCAFGEGVPRSLDPESIHLKAGPLMIDQIDVGGGLLFTDTTGHPPHQLADDGFGSIIWASARITIDFTEHISFTIRPIVYWLPFEGKVGYGLPPFIFGLPVLDPYSFTTLSYQAPIADWDVNIFDSFGAFYRYWTFWDRNQLRMNTWSDLSPIDLVGQYSLGGYGPQLDFALDGAPHSNISIFDKDRLYFENWSGFRALGKHGSNLQTMLYFDRRDRWDGQFNWDSAWMQGGPGSPKSVITTPLTQVTIFGLLTTLIPPISGPSLDQNSSLDRVLMVSLKQAYYGLLEPIRITLHGWAKSVPLNCLDLIQGMGSRWVAACPTQMGAAGMLRTTVNIPLVKT